MMIVYRGCALAALVVLGCATDRDLPYPCQAGESWCEDGAAIRCTDDGDGPSIHQAPCGQGQVCEETLDAAECISAQRQPCDASRRWQCDADGRPVRCGDTGFVLRGRGAACSAGSVCVEVDSDARCVRDPITACDRDRCRADGAVSRCDEAVGLVKTVAPCGPGAACRESTTGAVCVAVPELPCTGDTTVCSDDGLEVLRLPCLVEVGLAGPPEPTRRCHPTLEQCTEHDGPGRCELREPVPCQVEGQWIGPSAVVAWGDAVPGCVGALLTRCGPEGLAEVVRNCDRGCEVEVNEPVNGRTLVEATCRDR